MIFNFSTEMPKVAATPTFSRLRGTRYFPATSVTAHLIASYGACSKY